MVLQSAILCCPGPGWSPAIGEEQTCHYLHFSGSRDHWARGGHPEQGGPSRPVSSQHWKSVWTGLPDLNKGEQNGSAPSKEHNAEKSCQQQGQCGERQTTFISYDWTWERGRASTSITPYASEECWSEVMHLKCVSWVRELQYRVRSQTYHNSPLVIFHSCNYFIFRGRGIYRGYQSATFRSKSLGKWVNVLFTHNTILKWI